MDALVRHARRYPEAVIPGYTHMRRAQAVLWPHYLLAYFEMFARDCERFVEAAARQSAAARLGRAGSAFPFDREAMPEPSRASPQQHGRRGRPDFLLDFLYAASLTMLHLSRLAEDWILYSSEEFAWLDPGDAVTSGSSLMP
jgi:argininosuccinate lyase